MSILDKLLGRRVPESALDIAADMVGDIFDFFEDAVKTVDEATDLLLTEHDINTNLIDDLEAENAEISEAVVKQTKLGSKLKEFVG